MKGYERKSSQIREIANSPDINNMASTLTKSTEGLHHVVPNVSQSLQIAGTRALNFLQSKMPKPSTEMIGDQAWEPSKAQKSGWLNLHDIVNDPISALDHVRHGTFNSQHLEALSTVHPELLNEMQQKVMENMDPAAVKSLPTSTKMALGTFLGSPVSSSVLPQSLLANQSVYQAKGAQLQQGLTGKSNEGGLKELNLAKRAATDTEELESED